jgi:hypothetical protein
MTFRSRTFLAVGTTCVLLVGLMSAAPFASACERSGKHCYILIESGTATDEAGVADIETSQMNAVPEGDRMQNEQWTWFESSTHPWVEVGDTIGSIGYRPEGSKEGSGPHYVTSPVYFWAYFPDGEYPYTGAQEWDLGSGPTLGDFFEATEVAEGGGGWCAKINNVQMGCGGGFPTYATGIQSGLELAANIPPENLNNTNSATTEIYKMNTKGELLAPSVIEVRHNLTAGAEWCYQWPVDGHNNWLDFGTGSFSCSQKTNVVAAPLATATPLTARLTEANAAAATPPVINSGQPNEGYKPEKGRMLSRRELKAAAAAVAEVDGADGAPSSIETVPTTLRKAAAVVSSENAPPATTSAAMEQWWESDVDLLVLHGHFTLETMPIARWATGAPTGSVLDVILDAHTGAVDSIRVGNEAPGTLSALGAVAKLQ